MTNNSARGHRPHRIGLFTKEQVDLFDADTHHQVDTRGLRKYLQGEYGISVELDDGTPVNIRSDGFYQPSLDPKDEAKLVYVKFPVVLLSVTIPVGIGKLAYTFRLETYDRNGQIRAKPTVMVF